MKAISENWFFLNISFQTFLNCIDNDENKTIIYFYIKKITGCNDNWQWLVPQIYCTLQLESLPNQITPNTSQLPSTSHVTYNLASPMFPSKPPLTSLPQRCGGDTAGRVIVAVKAEKAISNSGLAWALTHAARPGDCITLLAIFSGNKIGNPIQPEKNLVPTALFSLLGIKNYIMPPGLIVSRVRGYRWEEILGISEVERGLSKLWPFRVTPSGFSDLEFLFSDGSSSSGSNSGT